jgi:hypothetical protein
MRKLLLITSFILIINGGCFAQHSAFQSHLGRPNTSSVAPSTLAEPVRPSMGSTQILTEPPSEQVGEGVAGSEVPPPSFVYDPYLDNHLRAPAKGLGTSLFGLKIGEAENILLGQGARNNSYAFGKYSRMRLSKYLIELNFNREKRVGAVKVTPVKPYNSVPPKAREYFMQIIMGDADVSQFKLSIAADELDIKYQGY